MIDLLLIHRVRLPLRPRVRCVAGSAATDKSFDQHQHLLAIMQQRLDLCKLDRMHVSTVERAVYSVAYTITSPSFYGRFFASLEIPLRLLASVRISLVVDGSNDILNVICSLVPSESVPLSRRSVSGLHSAVPRRIVTIRSSLT